MRNRTRLPALLGALALILASCGNDDAPGGGGAGGASDSITVTAADFAFDQTEISLEPGAEVELTLVNADDAPHSFTSDELGVQVEADGGEEASTTLTAPEEGGSFEFYCEFHPDQMTGTVVVGAGGGSRGNGDSDDDSKGAEDLDY